MNAVRTMTPMPEATRSSAAVKPACLSVNVVLQTILRDKGRHASRPLHSTGIPCERNRHLPHIIRIILCDRRVGDNNAAAVTEPAIVCSRIIRRCETGWHVCVGIPSGDLGPVVKPDQFSLFQKDLCGSGILPIELHTLETQ